jgi:hypothetical protein
LRFEAMNPQGVPIPIVCRHARGTIQWRLSDRRAGVEA